MKEKDAEEIGIYSDMHYLEKDTTQKELLNLIDYLNSDKKIDIFNIRKNYTRVSGINITTDIFCILDAKLKYHREKDKDDFKVIFGKLI
jgi:hypothetical protein